MTKDEVLKLDALARYELFRNDPLMFITHCVYTHDEVDQACPIKQFPIHLDYLKFLIRMWQVEKKLAVPKSRRLTVSWTFIALGLWDILFHKGRSWAFVSKKELDSLELVQRAKFIYDHIPVEMISPELLPKLKRDDMQTSPPVMEFPALYSKIMGFPAGADQMRQRGFSGLFFDEAAFWEDAEAAYASAEPTVKGGGKMVMVSTRNPGFFKKVVFDKFDEKDLNFPEIPPMTPRTRMEGVDVWKNPNNGFTVIDLSHRANPAKRDPLFESELRKSLPLHLFNLEYGKSWASFEGRMVYEDFNANIHLVHYAPDLAVGLPILLGWDSSGLTPAVVIAQLQEEQLIIFRELIGSGMGATRFVPWVAQYLMSEFPQVTDISRQTRSFFDPAGFKKNEITEQTYLSAMVAGGFTEITPGPMTWEKRREAVTERLVGLANKEPKLVVYEKGCPILAAGFKGGYRYSDSVANLEPDKVRPLKDIHCVDAKTQILTLEGWKYFNQIQVGDPIYEYDIERDCMIEGSILNTIHTTDVIEFTAFRNTKHDLRFTPNHRCVIRHKESKNIDIVFARDLKQGHLMFSPNALREPKKKKQLSDNFIELAAWVMTEGTMRNSGAYILCQSTTHNPHHVASIDALVGEFDDCFRKNNQHEMAQWHIRGTAQFLLNRLLPGKMKLPTTEFIRTMNNPQRRLFIYTTMCGDGDCAHKLQSGLYFERNKDLLYALPTARVRLQHKAQVDALQMMATLCGLKSSVLPCKDGMWSFTLSKEHKNADVQWMHKEQYNENFAWCPQTETGTWIMRRNGQIYVTGNSHPHDALQYLCGGLKSFRRDGGYINIPKPNYSFQKNYNNERPALRKRYA